MRALSTIPGRYQKPSSSSEGLPSDGMLSSMLRLHESPGLWRFLDPESSTFPFSNIVMFGGALCYTPLVAACVLILSSSFGVHCLSFGMVTPRQSWLCVSPIAERIYPYQHRSLLEKIQIPLKSRFVLEKEWPHAMQFMSTSGPMLQTHPSAASRSTSEGVKAAQKRGVSCCLPLLNSSPSTTAGVECFFCLRQGTSWIKRRKAGKNLSKS